jgi:prephenate dehydratase/prolyl-tRNA editing enzyme YbaK/EbsC (Cys-tRNA(Pro) deacylase)
LKVLEAVRDNTAGWGVVPYFNTTSGPVRNVYPALLDLVHGPFEGVELAACVSYPVSHDLLSSGSLEQIRRVYSKQEAIDQCSQFIRKNSWEAVAVASTSEALRRAEREGPKAAAIASGRLREFRPLLKVLVSEIQDDPHNITRFLLVRRSMPGRVAPKSAPAEPPRHTWLVFDSSAEDSVLSKMLAAADKWGAATSILTGMVADPQRLRMRFLLELDWPPSSPKMQFFLGETEHLPRVRLASPIVLHFEHVSALKTWIREGVPYATSGDPSENLVPMLSSVVQTRLTEIPDCRLYWHEEVKTMVDVWGVLGLPPDRMVNAQVLSTEPTGDLVICGLPAGRRADPSKVARVLGVSCRRPKAQDLENRGLNLGSLSPLTVPKGTTVLMDTAFPTNNWIFMGSGNPRISIAVPFRGSWPFQAIVAEIAE